MINTLLAIILLVVIVLFLKFACNNFNIHEKYTPISLNFDPVSSVSKYDWNGTIVKIQGGFVKGKMIDDNKTENLVLRSLSPTPVITVKGNPDADRTCYIRLENVNPVNTIVKNIQTENIKITDPHTILIILKLKRNEEKTVECEPKDKKDYFEFVILGDNRNGYETFSQIIQQVNIINPIWVIDNGDLVFGGEANKYRLFYETVSKLQVPLYTTLGNHDIRENGRARYTKLFGPPYYSFTYRDAHFVFLDSSRGWSEKRAIPEEEYTWLENDLKSTDAKHIYVISHIPPVDPRTHKKPNKFPEIPGVEKTNFFEKIMNNYSEYKSLNHGFQDLEEAKKFENLMSKYNVNIVSLSHIHSYFSYIKDNVRYIISGGAGAELLTTNSYYHYLRVKITDKDEFIEMIQLPSPVNRIQDRYIAAIQLFANSIYKEYKTMVILISILVAAFLLWILYCTYNKWWPFLKFI